MELDIAAQIETWLAELDAALAQSSTRERRDAAQAVYEKLLALREEIEPHASTSLRSHMDNALAKSRQLHDAFHAELQHELEWAACNTGDHEQNA
ncbi:MAG: hypothetical protein QM709_12210 [Spongiibacteraceae bacterium]